MELKRFYLQEILYFSNCAEMMRCPLYSIWLILSLRQKISDNRSQAHETEVDLLQDLRLHSKLSEQADDLQAVVLEEHSPRVELLL